MSLILGKYLTKNEIFNSLPPVTIAVEELISADSYDEELILEKIKKISENDIKLLVKCAVQIAVIGAGNKNYGAVRLNDDIIQLKDIFEKNNIKYINVRNAVLKPDDLTPRRLVRIFRYHVQEFIKQTKRPSYLWLKYSDRNHHFAEWCFPGAEHLVETIEQFQYLYQTYTRLDSVFGTTFIARLNRVGIARGIIKPNYIINE